MKTVAIIAALVIATAANAATWHLVGSTIISGITFACDYRLGNYTITVINNGMCPAFINR